MNPSQIEVQEQVGQLSIILDDFAYAIVRFNTPEKMSRFLKSQSFPGLASVVQGLKIPLVGYLYGIEVAEERRGRGFGKAMLRALLRRLRELGVSEVYLHAANTASAEFFKGEEFAFVDCCYQDFWPVMKLSLEPSRTSLGASKREESDPEDWQFMDMVRALSDPILVYDPSWPLPDDLKQIVNMDRMIQIMKANNEGKRPDMATDSEVLAYLMSASMNHPFDTTWANIYIWLGWRVFGKKAEKAFGKPPLILGPDEKEELDQLKRWIWNERLKVYKERKRRTEIGDPDDTTIIIEYPQHVWLPEIKEEWLGRLNSIRGIEILSAEAGGTDGKLTQGPAFSFSTGFWQGSTGAPDRVREDFASMVRSYFSILGNVNAWWDGQRVAFLIASPTYNGRTNEKRFNDWWEQAIEMLESLHHAVLMDAGFALAKDQEGDSY